MYIEYNACLVFFRRLNESWIWMMVALISSGLKHPKEHQGVNLCPRRLLFNFAMKVEHNSICLTRHLSV